MPGGSLYWTTTNNNNISFPQSQQKRSKKHDYLHLGMNQRRLVGGGVKSLHVDSCSKLKKDTKTLV